MKLNIRIIFAFAILLFISIILFVLLRQNKADTELTIKDTNKIESVLPKDQDFGLLIAGKKSNYYEFTQDRYEKALKDGKIIFLDFYANWCPICRAEAPEIELGFKKLTREDIVGFRVNFKDDMTDENENTLARQFSVPYQHTKIILVDGKEIRRSSDQWDSDTFLSELERI